MIASTFVIGSLLGPASVLAHSPPPQGGALRAFEVWGGLGDRSPKWGVLGGAPDMSLGILALRLARPIRSVQGGPPLPAFEWTMDWIPVALMSPPLVSLRGTGVPCPDEEICVLEPGPTSGGRRFPSGTAFGVGVAPGVTRRFRRASTVSPFAGITAGLLYFDRRVPTTQASKFNFTASLEFGLRLGRPDHAAATVSYRFHHLSNAGLSDENPGLASHLLSIGIHRPRLW